MSEQNEAVIVTDAEKINLDNIHTDHTASDLFKVGFTYALGGGGVNAIIGVRFLIGDGPHDTAAAIMFFVVSSLMIAAGVWCHIKRHRILKAART